MLYSVVIKLDNLYLLKLNCKWLNIFVITDLSNKVEEQVTGQHFLPVTEGKRAVRKADDISSSNTVSRRKKFE